MFAVSCSSNIKTVTGKNSLQRFSSVLGSYSYRISPFSNSKRNDFERNGTVELLYISISRECWRGNSCEDWVFEKVEGLQASLAPLVTSSAAVVAIFIMLPKKKLEIVTANSDPLNSGEFSGIPGKSMGFPVAFYRHSKKILLDFAAIPGFFPQKSGIGVVWGDLLSQDSRGFCANFHPPTPKLLEFALLSGFLRNWRERAPKLKFSKSAVG